MILDIDGVLTDGTITTDAEGEPFKVFHTQDGCAIKLWQRQGGQVALLSGREAPAIRRRAADLGIEHVHTGVSDKLPVYETILRETGCEDAVVAVVGDDLPDLGPMNRCAFPVAVANATPTTKRAAAYITRRRGGAGAVAEVIELLLRKRGRWPGDFVSHDRPCARGG